MGRALPRPLRVAAGRYHIFRNSLKRRIEGISYLAYPVALSVRDKVRPPPVSYTHLQKLLYITIPQVRKAAGMILFLAVINSFKVFREAYIVAGSYPNDRIYLLQHLFNHWFLNLDVQKMCAAAVLLTIVIGIFLIPFVIRAGGDE